MKRESISIIYKNLPLTLDTGATSHIFPSKFARNLKDLNRKVDVITSDGSQHQGKLVMDELFGMATVLDNSPMNLLSFSELINQGWDAKYNKRNDSFTLVKDKNKISFNRINGLYQMDPTVNFSLGAKIYGHKKLEDAVCLHERLGHRSDEYLKRTIEGGSIKTNVSVNDLVEVRKYMDPCIACAIGGSRYYSKKSNKKDKKSEEFGSDLHIDIMKYRGLYYLVGKEEAYGFSFVRKIKSKKSDEIQAAISGIITEIKSFPGSNKVKRIYSDLEKGITSISNWMNEQGIRNHTTEAEGHDGMAERLIQAIKKIARIQENNLSYDIHADMRESSVYHACTLLNFVVNKRTWDSGKSPWSLASGRILDASRHLKAVFGEILLFISPYRPNSHSPRAEWGIYLGNNVDSTGSMKVKLIESGEFVIRKDFKRFNNPPDDILNLLREEGINSKILCEDNSNELDNEYEEKELNGFDKYEKKDVPGFDLKNLPENLTEFVPKSSYNNLIEEEEDGDNNIIEGSDNINHLGSPKENIENFNNLSNDIEDSEKTYRIPNQALTNNRYSLRERKPVDYYSLNNGNLKDQEVKISFLSIGQARKLHPDKFEESLKEEIKQFIDKDVFYPIYASDLGGEIAIPLLVLFTVKSDGRLKCRIVANGKVQNKENYFPWDSNASTIPIQNIYKVLSVAASKDLQLSTIDIKGAYLNANIKKKIAIKFTGDAAIELIKIKPEFKKFVEPDGTIFAILNRALYGLTESALLWQEEFTNGFKSIGYHPLISDPCIMVNGENIATLYVDDSLLATKSNKDLSNIHDNLRKRYGSITTSFGNKFVCRGLEIEQNIKKGEIKICQNKYIRELLQCHPDVKRIRTSPAGPDLFQDDLKSPILNKKMKDEFLKNVAKLNWLATQTRPDLKTVTSVLASKVSEPRLCDWVKMKRALQYLLGSQNLYILIKKGNNIIRAWVDASHMTHNDLKGHTGYVIKCGDNFVQAVSRKQKITAQSSTESEIIAINDVINDILNSRMVLEEMGIHQPPTIIFEDNMSAIVAARKGMPTARLKHIRLRQFHVQENIGNGNIQLVHCPTQEMTADILTKPMVGATFEKHRKNMMEAKVPLDNMDIEGCIKSERLIGFNNESIKSVDPASGCDKRYQDIVNDYI